MSDPTQQSELNIDKQRLGAVYATALIHAIEKQGQDTDAVVEELDSLVVDVLARFPELDAALGSPRIAHEEKTALLDRVFGSQMSESLLTFLKVVSQHSRLDCLREIRLAAHKELNRLRNRLAVSVTTAEPLDAAQQQSIIDRIQDQLGKSVELTCHVDPHIIGGLVMRIGDTVYDGSVLNRLQRVKRETVERVAAQIKESLDRFAMTG